MLSLDNLTAYSLQVAVLAAIGIALPAVFRLRMPRVLHAYLQVLLAGCLLLPVLQPWKHRVVETVAEVSFGDARTAAASAAKLATILAAETVLLVLGIGIAARALWLLIGLSRLKSYRKNARPLPDLPLGAQEMQSRMGVCPRFYVSSQIGGPVTFGLRPPAILLPGSFLEMDPGLQQAIVCHELLHVRRRDWIYTLGEEVVRVIFWFHPVLLWLVERIRLTREQVVDGLVVQWTNARNHYMEALLKMAATPVRAGVAAPSFVRRHHLTERIRLLLKEAPMSRPRLILSLAAVVVTVILAGSLAVRYFPLETVTREEPAAPKAIQKVFRVGDGAVSAPVLQYKVEPKYSEEARNAKLQGTVVLYAEVTPEGRADNIKVLKSLGLGLDEKAIKAIRQWKFKPGMKDGKPVRVAATIEINFRLT